ncbi:MAG: hypothetical protein A3G08_00635 [Candidatus Magasanikbacteria bacterium RIFCSPLOWO2_12_FULL_47_9b]|nr:MAG: hypothetical protein A3I74_03455 [Candidatus Magasanikbacteria bacterium RIFCSPLOWO2_02_FULL_47_16]OGH80261.1 MAG: hypothetical protein A3C10_03735 [Candidatus Magasanikbacteria bacterium RIFCSPHIGHO2_02_FULL_48_18]OGH81990.1 MAG: hypothetical protein A3G08_00635 [Candidatus Magasanikbacteria bacterium RIFCSPLOWO2_12_FULL_47_9b]
MAPGLWHSKGLSKREDIYFLSQEVKPVSELKRRKGESFEAFMRRVKQGWQRSGKLLQVRKVQFFEPKKSKNVQRRNAIKRASLHAKMDYLRKIGKLPPEDMPRR